MTNRNDMGKQTAILEKENGPAWLRSLLIMVLAGLILGTTLLAHATRIALDTAERCDFDQPVSVWVHPYGTRDPYGFGPMANAKPGTPGGAANQESLSANGSGEQEESSRE